MRLLQATGEGTEKMEKTEMSKEMQVKEGTTYTIGEFECPVCHSHHVLKCNPKGRTKKHWVE
jgi:hypothetical protein